MVGVVLKRMSKEDGDELAEDRSELGGCDEIAWGIKDVRGGCVIAVGGMEKAGTHIISDGEGAVELDLTVEMEKKGSGGRGFGVSGADAVMAEVSDGLCEVAGYAHHSKGEEDTK